MIKNNIWKIYPPSCPPRVFPFNLSSVSSSFVPLFPHPKKERALRLSVSLLLHLFNLLIRAVIEPQPGPVQVPCSVSGGWVAFLYGVWPVVPPPLLRESLPSRQPAAGPVEQPHMLHTGPTCSTNQGAAVLRFQTDTFDPIIQGLPLQAVPLHRTQSSSPDELHRFVTCLRERQVPAV